jgi:hypothetical protein
MPATNPSLVAGPVCCLEPGFNKPAIHLLSPHFVPQQPQLKWSQERNLAVRAGKAHSFQASNFAMGERAESEL